MPLNQASTLHNHIHVSVRMKPITGEVGNPKTASAWQKVGQQTITDRLKKETFIFNRVHDPQETTKDIYTAELEEMMSNALKGYNVTVISKFCASLWADKFREDFHDAGITSCRPERAAGQPRRRGGLIAQNGIQTNKCSRQSQA